jgi:MFS family permease
MCTFAAQSSLLTLSPILPDIAADFDMSVGAVGQLRTVSGLVAGIAALRITLRPPQTSLRRLLAGGLSLLALGSLISAAAPSFPALVGAQLPIGLGLAAVLSGSLAAADRWATPEGRGRLLSWALMGQPASWIVGMPIVGFVGTVHWRFSWLAVPLAASALALAGIRKAGGREPCEPAISLRSLLRERPLVLWTLGEFLAFSAWAGTLVYVGALFVDSYGLSIGGTGLILGGVAVAYLLLEREVKGKRFGVLFSRLPSLSPHPARDSAQALAARASSTVAATESGASPTKRSSLRRTSTVSLSSRVGREGPGCQGADHRMIFIFNISPCDARHRRRNRRPGHFVPSA